MTARTRTAITEICAFSFLLAANGEPARHTAPRQEVIQVIDIVVVSTNQVVLGGNTMSLAAATNVIDRYRNTLDVIAVHGVIDGSVAERTSSSTVAEIARAGIALVLVESKSSRAWQKKSGDDGVWAMKIGTAQYAALRRFWHTGRDEDQRASETVFQTTVDWNTAAGTYELKRIELGLLGESVWLVHELRESDEKAGTLGIQFRKKW
jgi:hypothetical protein